MKKVSYSEKTNEELNKDLVSFRTVVRDAIAKPTLGKNNKEYTMARKNIARILTVLNSRPAQVSTEAEK